MLTLVPILDMNKYEPPKSQLEEIQNSTTPPAMQPTENPAFKFTSPPPIQSGEMKPVNMDYFDK